MYLRQVSNMYAEVCFKAFLLILVTFITRSQAINFGNETTKPKYRQPNIIFILADDLGFNDVSYNGNRSAVKTPHIDKLAAEGVKLSNYYVQPVCSPTRSQLMTGRYQIHTGMQHFVITPCRPYCLPLDEVTLAQKLKEAGYSTHIVGKWHLGFYKKECLPTNRGFDNFFGYYNGAENHFIHTVNWPVNNSFAFGYDLHRASVDSYETSWKEFGQYSTTMFTREANKVIRHHASSNQPLFLYLSYAAPHNPLQVPQQYLKPYQNLTGNRQTLAAMITYMDQAIGEVTETLKKTGLYDNSIIIFSSDNGGAFNFDGNNWPLRGTKNTLFEGGIRSAAFIHSPLLPRRVRGQTNNAFIHVSDWFPTIVSSLAGGSLNGTKPLDGFDVWDSIVSNKQSPRKELLHNIDPLPRVNPPSTTGLGRAALRMGDWKLILGDPGAPTSWIPPPESGLPTVISDDPPEKTTWLFDIANDPLERHDLSLERPFILRKMMNRIHEYNQTAVPTLWPDPDPNSDPALHDRVWGPWE